MVKKIDNIVATNSASMSRMMIIFCATIAAQLLFSCNPFQKSWDTIYQEQKDLFTANRQIFENSAIAILNEVPPDMTVMVTDSALSLPKDLTVALAGLGINRIEVISKSKARDCNSGQLRFIPDSLWSHERFSVLYIQYNTCDERSKKHAHWTLKGSEHKHAFGMGGGWLIYSDSDGDPF